MIKFFNFKKKKKAEQNPQEQNNESESEITQSPTLEEPPAEIESEGQKKEILDEMFYKVEIEKNEGQEIEVPQENENPQDDSAAIEEEVEKLESLENIEQEESGVQEDAANKIEENSEMQGNVSQKTAEQKENIEPQDDIPEEQPETPENFAEVQENIPQENAEQQENVAASEKPLYTLRANSLYKSFGKKQVVKGVDFYLNTGEVLGLLGPNGSGKTTSFYMIIGFYKPTRGEVFLDKTRITGLPMYKRAKMGISYLPQEPSVFRKLTVEENIWAILERRRDLTKAQKKAVLEELIDEFSIRKIRRQYAYTLSGGERRRTEIARSLAIDPKFLLLDEPFAGIDPIAVADLKKMISILKNRGIGILITDHNVRDTLEITDRAVIIYNGEIITQGTRDEILRDDKAKKFYLGNDFEM